MRIATVANGRAVSLVVPKAHCMIHSENHLIVSSENNYIVSVSILKSMSHSKEISTSDHVNIDDKI